MTEAVAVTPRSRKCSRRSNDPNWDPALNDSRQNDARADRRGAADGARVEAKEAKEAKEIVCPKQSAARTMIRIAISVEAYEAIVATLALGAVAYRIDTRCKPRR